MNKKRESSYDLPPGVCVADPTITCPYSFSELVKERDKLREAIQEAPCPQSYEGFGNASLPGPCAYGRCICWKRAALGEKDDQG